MTKDYTYKNNTENVQPEASAASVAVFHVNYLPLPLR